MNVVQNKRLMYNLKPEDTLFFLHIPKTAGTSLCTILNYKFAPPTMIRKLFFATDLPDTTSNILAAYRLIHGHVHYHRILKLLGKPPITITMFRDPVERVLSFYGYIKQPGVTFKAQATHQSLLEFLQNPAIRPYIHNLQTNMLAAQIPFKPHNLQGAIVEQYWQQIVDQAMLEHAKQVLESFAFVGLTERFDDSLALLNYIFGWPPDPVAVYERKTLERPQRTDLSAEELGIILSLNEYDLQLYHYAQKLFEDQFTAMQYRLLEQHGDRSHAYFKPPLPDTVLLPLLEKEYIQRYCTHHPTVSELVLTADQIPPEIGWYWVECNSLHGFFRWTGPQTRSILDLPLAAECALRLQVRVLLVLDQEILNSLQVLINGVPLEIIKVQEPAGTWLLDAIIPVTVLAYHPGMARLCFVVPHTIVPNQIDPGNPDRRSLGLAINWIAVTPVQEMDTLL